MTAVNAQVDAPRKPKDSLFTKLGALIFVGCAGTNLALLLFGVPLPLPPGVFGAVVRGCLTLIASLGIAFLVIGFRRDRGLRERRYTYRREIARLSIGRTETSDAL